VLRHQRGRWQLDVDGRRPLAPVAIRAQSGLMYNDGHRELQDRFDSRRIADRLEQVTVHVELSDGDVEFIEGSSMFFLGTADGDGWPDVSYKGGRPGFVRCLDRRTIAFPSYDGNGMFRSLGNVLVNERVALLFVNFEQPDRLRVHGRASVADVDPLLPTWEGAQAVVRVTVVRAFPNCPRYIHQMALQQLSVFAPAPGHQPPEPAWKAMEEFRGFLPSAHPAEG
jgi:predicted pyridoxine 5'-phosphate oxidase superfamily flavin-nucleotide-binding protein